MAENYKKVNTPFYLEVEFDEIYPRTEAILLDAVNGNGQLLPGLKIKRMFDIFDSPDNTENSQVEEMMKDFNYIKRMVNRYDEKYAVKPQQEQPQKKSEVKVEEKKPVLKTSKLQPTSTQSSPKMVNKFQSEWIENTGKEQIIPDMIF